MSTNQYALGEIARIINAELIGEEQCLIHGIASLEKANQGQISFLVNSRYQLVASSRYEKLLPHTKASAVLLSPQFIANCQTNKLVMADPYKGLIQLASLFQKKPTPEKGIHPTAVIGKECVIGNNVSIGAFCVIGSHCVIGENTCIEANSILSDNVVIGKEGYLFAKVTIYPHVKIGDRIVIHSGAVIGSEGFGMIREPQGWKTIPHLGSVIIGNDVVIGANTTIDRGSLDDTIIENGVKLDNQIQVAHGVVIGENTVVAGCVGIAGSTQIGKNCMIGGGTGINDNIVIADNVIFTGMAQVTKSISKPGVYSSGTGIQPQKEWHKSIARFHRLDDLARKLRKMEKEKDE
jgi:UDP-3-O-[3-hydroxymyristoyl] glucosamine N-acyltransferase